MIMAQSWSFRNKILAGTARRMYTIPLLSATVK